MKQSTYRRIARFYDLLDLPFERGRYRRLRPAAFAGLSGRLLDAGVGTGRNMPFYPASAEIVGIDLSAEMLARAQARSARLGTATALARMDVLETGFADDCFDAVAATFLFCVLEPAEQLPALRELARICKPGGEIRLIEYAYPEGPLARFVMRLWAPWARWAFGARFDIRTEEHFAEAGLELIERRFLHRDIVKLLVVRPT